MALESPSRRTLVALSTVTKRTPSASVVSSRLVADRRADGEYAQVTIDNVTFDALCEHEVVTHVFGALSRGRGGSLITPNVDILRQLRHPQFRGIAEEAELVVPDGMPIVWASRLRGESLPERVTGSSLIWSLSRAAAATNRSLYLLGGAEGIAERAAQRLQDAVSDLEADDAQLRNTVAAVVDAKPDLVFVALGFPKQERLMRLLRDHLPETWFIGCGGTLTMVAGEVSRAPEWVQRNGLEWVHRLAMEPRRMAKRYLVHDLPYAAGLMARSVLAGRRR